MKHALRILVLAGVGSLLVAAGACDTTTKNSTGLPQKLTAPSEAGNLQAENEILRSRVEQLENELRELRASQAAAAPANGATSQPGVMSELYAEGQEEWLAKNREIDQEIDAQQANLSAVNANHQLSAVEANLDSQNIQANIDGLRAQKDQLQLQKGKYLPTLKEIQVGAMGMLRDNCYVFQLIDSTDVLVKRGTQVLWFKNVDASGLTEGSSLQIADPMRVTGTTVYQTASGRNATVYVLEPLTLTADAQ